MVRKNRHETEMVLQHEKAANIRLKAIEAQLSLGFTYLPHFPAPALARTSPTRGRAPAKVKIGHFRGWSRFSRRHIQSTEADLPPSFPNS